MIYTFLTETCSTWWCWNEKLSKSAGTRSGSNLCFTLHKHASSSRLLDSELSLIGEFLLMTVGVAGHGCSKGSWQSGVRSFPSSHNSSWSSGEGQTIWCVSFCVRPLSSSVTPALGLAWANQVLVRLMIRRLQKTVSRGDQSSALRQLEVVFAPHLARSKCEVAVWREGVRGVAAFE